MHPLLKLEMLSQNPADCKDQRTMPLAHLPLASVQDCWRLQGRHRPEPQSAANRNLPKMRETQKLRIRCTTPIGFHDLASRLKGPSPRHRSISHNSVVLLPMLLQQSKSFHPTFHQAPPPYQLIAYDFSGAKRNRH